MTNNIKKNLNLFTFKHFNYSSNKKKRNYTIQTQNNFSFKNLNSKIEFSKNHSDMQNLIKISSNNFEISKNHLLNFIFNLRQKKSKINMKNILFFIIDYNIKNCSL